MKLYRTREGAVTDDDVKTQLTTLGSQTAPGPLLVPGGAKFLTAMRVASVSSNEAADQWGSLFRLEGPGIERGLFLTVGHAGGGSVATGGSALTTSKRIPVNIGVREGQEIGVFAEALGDDMGTYQFAVELEFSDTAGPEGEIKGEITVEGDITAVDTRTNLTTQGSVSAPSRIVPPDATKIKRVVCAFASDNAADGEVTVHLRLGGDAIRGGEQNLLLGAASYIDVQSGSDSGHGIMSPIILEDLDIEVTPNETLDLVAEMAGVDIGTVTVAVSVQFA